MAPNLRFSRVSKTYTHSQTIMPIIDTPLREEDQTLKLIQEMPILDNELAALLS